MKVVLVSAPAEAADSLARTLVEEGLAACVSALPGATSVYRWKGAVETAAETLLLAKTSDDSLPSLTARIRALHPYEVPEIVALDAAWTLGAYEAWVKEVTGIRKMDDTAADERSETGASPVASATRTAMEDTMAAKKKAAKKPAKKTAKKKKK